MAGEKPQRRKKRNKRRGRILLGIVFSGVVILTAAFLIIFHIDSVEIVGNTRNSDVAVRKSVLTGPFASNSFLLSRTRKKYQPDDLDFVNSVQVEMVSPSKIRIHVSEKQLIGYVKYLDCYMYFDKDGIVNESQVAEEMDAKSSTEDEEDVLADVPYITGLMFDSIAVNEKLPVENENVFNTILGITRMVNKNDIKPDEIAFDEEYNITLYYGDIRINLGQDTLLEEKITRVVAILPKLSGKAGELHLEDYAADTENIIFSQDIEEDESDDGTEDESDESSDEETEDASDESYDDQTEDASDESYDEEYEDEEE